MRAGFGAAQSPAILLDDDRYGLVTAADRRFRRIVARFGMPMLAFAIAVPLLQLERALPPAPMTPPRTLRRVELLPPQRPWLLRRARAPVPRLPA